MHVGRAARPHQSFFHLPHVPADFCEKTSDEESHVSVGSILQRSQHPVIRQRAMTVPNILPTPPTMKGASPTSSRGGALDSPRTSMLKIAARQLTANDPAASRSPRASGSFSARDRIQLEIAKLEYSPRQKAHSEHVRSQIRAAVDRAFHALPPGLDSQHLEAVRAGLLDGAFEAAEQLELSCDARWQSILDGQHHAALAKLDRVRAASSTQMLHNKTAVESKANEAAHAAATQLAEKEAELEREVRHETDMR